MARMGQWAVERWTDLGRQLAEARQSAGKTQVALAAEIGVSKSTIKAIEYGRPYEKVQANHRAVAQAVGWTPGSVEDVLDGRRPTVAGGSRSAAGAPASKLPEGLSDRARLELGSARAFDDTVVRVGLGRRKVIMILTEADDAVSPEELRKDIEMWEQIQRAVWRAAPGDSQA